MIDSANISVSGELAVGRQEEAVPWLCLLTAPFILLTVAFSVMPGWNYAVKGFGVLLAVAFLIRSMNTRIRVSGEFYLYLGWIVWCSTGIFVCEFPEDIVGSLQTLSQILIMIFVVMGATYLRKTLTLNLLAVLGGVFIVGFYSFITGEYSKPDDPGGRVAGIALNANAFGFLMVTGTIALAYLWMIPHRHPWPWHIVLMALMALATVATILSGSRAAILSLVAFYFFWGFFCYRAEIFRRPKVLGAVVAAILAVTIMFSFLYVGSLAERRFGSLVAFLHGERYEGSAGTRWHMYLEGVSILERNPIFGVGIDQFINNTTTEHVAHSEYVEVFADTGIVGGIIYFSIFVVLWIRAGKIARHTRDLTQFRIARLVRAVLVVAMISNFARWQYYNKISWIVFASFIGYTSAVWGELSSRSNSSNQSHWS